MHFIHYNFWVEFVIWFCARTTPPLPMFVFVSNLLIWSLNFESNFKMQRWLICIIWHSIRASTSVDAKSYKMQKILHFTHFDQNNTHISGCKIVHKCIIVTVTVHIYTVIVALTFNILVIFSLSLSLVAHSHLTLPFSHSIKSSNHPISRRSKHGSCHRRRSKRGSCLWISCCLMVLISGFLVGSSNHPISR